MPKIEKENLSHKVYCALKEMIANHRFQPGSRLNVERITEEFGVSRTPVWEAVRRLQQEGLLENSPNRGVFMAVLTPAQAMDLYQVREVLEGMAALLAATRIDDAGLRKLDECLAAQKGIVERGDLVAFSRSDFEFHATIYDACGNPVLKELLENIKNKMRPINMHVQGYLSTFYADHQILVQALREHDPKSAERAFRRHNRNVMKIIRDEMRPSAAASQRSEGSSAEESSGAAEEEAV